MTDIKQLMLDRQADQVKIRKLEETISRQERQLRKQQSHISALRTDNARLTHKLERTVEESIGRRKLHLAVLDWDKETGQLTDGLRRAIRDDIALSCAHDKASKRAA